MLDVVDVVVAVLVFVCCNFCCVLLYLLETCTYINRQLSKKTEKR